jgi:Mrp family chromosome partitioning ATPase
VRISSTAKSASAKPAAGAPVDEVIGSSRFGARAAEPTDGMSAGGVIDGRVVIAFDPNHEDAMRARSIRAELLAMWPTDGERQMHAVALVAIDPGSNLPVIAANLAASMAQLDRETLIVDADFARPMQHELMCVPNERGLATILAGQGGAAGTMLPTAVRGLTVMPAGSIDDTVRDTLEQRPILEVLEQGTLRADIVIVPISGRSDQALATILTHFDAVIPIVRRGRTLMRRLTSLVDALAAKGLPVCGVVLSD